MNDTTPYEEKIMAYLRAHAGEVMLPSLLARKFKVGESATSEKLNSLAAEGKLRRQMTKGKRMGFYVPAESQLAAERRMAEQTHIKPLLRVTSERLELYARLNAERAAHPSIG